jgi:hypothetical protein
LLNVILAPGGQVQIAMDASDAVSLVAELGKVANNDSALTAQLLALLKDLIEKQALNL